MKKALSILLVLALLVGMAPGAFAATDEAINAAETLYSLGLFKGTGTNADGTPAFELDRTPTRDEAVTMLVRLLGKEKAALAGTWETPFTDVEDWAKPYVCYAYANGLTKGTGKTTFGGTSLVSATQYLSFVLRALGYESEKDFQWDKAWELSDEIGITNGEYNAENNNDFIRGNVAEISVSTLPAAQKDSKETLAEKLIGEGVFTQEQYDCLLSNDPENQEPADDPDGNDDPAGDKDQPFTLTAFRDRAMHEYLMSLNPTIVSLGPSFPDCEFDDYCYADQFIADTILEKIQEMYEFVEIVPALESGQESQWKEFHGTRISTMESAVYGRAIFIATFSNNGLFYQTNYYIRARRSRSEA